MRDFLGLESWTKNKELQRSDWGAWPLSSAQKTYAASDVFLALHIGLEMKRLEIEGSRSSSAASAPNPAPVSLSSSNALSLSFFEPRLNNIQKECVERIVKGEHQSYPYVVFGSAHIRPPEAACSCVNLSQSHLCASAAAAAAPVSPQSTWNGQGECRSAPASGTRADEIIAYAPHFVIFCLHRRVRSLKRSVSC